MTDSKIETEYLYFHEGCPHTPRDDGRGKGVSPDKEGKAYCWACGRWMEANEEDVEVIPLVSVQDVGRAVQWLRQKTRTIKHCTVCHWEGFYDHCPSSTDHELEEKEILSLEDVDEAFGSVLNHGDGEGGE